MDWLAVFFAKSLALMVWMPVTECSVAIIATKFPLESVLTVDGVESSLGLFWTNWYPSYVTVICELVEKVVPVILIASPMLVVLVLSQLAEEPEATVDRSEDVLVPSA